LSYLIDIIEQNGVAQLHSKQLDTDRPVTIGTEADCEVRVVDLRKPIKLYVRALQTEFQVKNVRAGVFTTSHPLRKIVLNKLYRIGSSSFIYIREKASPPPPNQTALYEAAEELEGGGETTAAEPGPWRDRTNSYMDLYSVSLNSIAKEPLKNIFGTDVIATFDVDMTLWAYLAARELTKEVETLPDLDDMAWLVPGDAPAKKADLAWANDTFTSMDREVVSFGSVHETVGDVLGNDVRRATEVYERLWRFIFERNLIRRTSLA